MGNIRDSDPLYVRDETTLNEWLIGFLGFLGLVALVVWNVSA